MDEPEVLPPRAAYDRWAPSYAQSGRNPLTRAGQDLLESLLPPLVDMDLLDLACGDGRWTEQALAAGARSCIAADFSAGMLGAARATPRRATGGGRHASPPFRAESFDLVILALALSHARRPALVIDACAVLLRRAGRLAILDLHPSAAERGWHRSFRDEAGRRLAVAWQPWSIDAVEDLMRSAGLDLEARREVTLDPDRLPTPAPSSASAGPALYALVARRAP